MTVKETALDLILATRAAINRIVDARWENDPFGTEPRASASEYLELFERARGAQYPEVDSVERKTGYAIDREWLDGLALHTQIVKKKSELAYPHGRLLYSLLRAYLDSRPHEFVTILETGTARGFSALCMAKALDDAGADGRIVTVDVLPHQKAQIWNCIDDHEGKKSRAQLLSPWAKLKRRILFVQGDTLYQLPRLGVERVNFAFLDAQHTKAAVLAEYEVVASQQEAGDVIFFDDVTENVFPGVVKAVATVKAGGVYRVDELRLSEERAYAWATKN